MISEVILRELEWYIEENYIDLHNEHCWAGSMKSIILEDRVAFSSFADCDMDIPMVLDEGFRDMLLRKIDEKHMTDAQCYNKAQINRAHFNKIKNDKDYNVQKKTVMAFIIALELDIDEAEEMLQKAGYALSYSSVFDVILRFFIENEIYDINVINEYLLKEDQELLGSGIRE